MKVILHTYMWMPHWSDLRFQSLKNYELGWFFCILHLNLFFLLFLSHSIIHKYPLFSKKMYLYYTFYDLLFAQNCSYETSSFKNKPILKFSVPIYHEYIYDNFCWKVFDKRNLTWFDWDTYYMRGSRIFFSWGRDDGVCPGGVGVGGVPRLFSFYFLYLINLFQPHPTQPPPV